VVAEGIERASVVETLRGSENGKGRMSEDEEWKARWWNVRGKKVLELGAGTSLRSYCSSAPSVEGVMLKLRNEKQLADLLPRPFHNQ
jgi:hypothetical protein